MNLSSRKKSLTRFTKFSLVLFSFVLIGFFSARVSSAWTPWSFLEKASGDFCNPTQALFAHIALDQPQQSIVRFAYNYDTTRYLKLFYNVFGMSIDNAIRCVGTIPALGINLNILGKACTVFTGAAANPPICGTFFFGTAGAGDNMAFSNSPVSGSLIGVYHTMKDAVRYADPPPNLAYFAGQEFKNVPFVGKALAQTDPNFSRATITKIYYGWKFIRNLAFGLMALVMLVVGIMMINRTKVNSQTIVTLQYALPRIIIATILIAFSYPIAATLTNLFMTLSENASRIVTNTLINELDQGELAGMDWSTLVDGTGSLNLVTLVMYLVTSLFQLVAMGPILMIVMLSTTIIVIIQSIIIFIKWLLTYVKMLIEIMLSPVDLFLSALPGVDEKESKVVKWFKKFLAYGISLIVLTGMPTLVLTIALSILVSGMLNPAEGSLHLGIALPSISQLAMGGVGNDILIAMLVMIMGLGMVIKLPGQIQYVLMGDAPKSRK